MKERLYVPNFWAISYGPLVEPHLIRDASTPKSVPNFLGKRDELSLKPAPDQSACIKKE
jgi:hypothetical protein